MRQIVVAKAGGDYSTIQQALDSIPKDNDQWVEILLKPGFYHECLEIETPFIRLIGEDAKTTVISYNNGAATILPDGTRRGTFRSYSVFVGCHDFTAENITFENAAGPGHIAGQSLALYADGDRLAFYNCRFLGYQDTIFTGPLPPSCIIPNSFVGPRETRRGSTEGSIIRTAISGEISTLFSALPPRISRAARSFPSVGTITGAVPAALPQRLPPRKGRSMDISSAVAGLHPIVLPKVCILAVPGVILPIQR